MVHWVQMDLVEFLPSFLGHSGGGCSEFRPGTFCTGVIILNLNSNILVLIPKVLGAASMAEFRLIALANFQFKIVTKILEDRLATICMCDESIISDFNIIFKFILFRFYLF